MIDDEDQGRVIVSFNPGEKCIRNIPVLTVVCVGDTAGLVS